MEISVSMVMMSHLSDLVYIADDPKKLNRQTNWLKYLVMTYPNTETLIDPDKVWETFLTKFPQFNF